MNDALYRLVQSFEADTSLLLPDELHRRLRVLDLMDSHQATDSIPSGENVEHAALRQHASELSAQLEAVNAIIYAEIRLEIQRGNGAAALFRWVACCVASHDEREPVSGMGYDSLDELIQGVFAFEQPNSHATPLDPEMVFYQPTPARHLLRFIELTKLTDVDVLMDLGSGLGHVPLLVSICTEARSIGIELEASYIACARHSAQRLNLRRVLFLHQDARTADLSAGTVFYLYTPFTGSMMRTVLDRLRAEAANRRIRVCTYGPSTAVVSNEPWLQAMTAPDSGRIAVFTSRVQEGE